MRRASRAWRRSKRVDGILFPLWQVDESEYRAVCAHLGLTPDARLYERLSRYLAEAPCRFAPPKGFARYLAGRRLSGFRIRRMDAMTKLFLPGHPLRHLLNGVVALHECDGRGYRELSRAPVGAAAWRSLFALTARIGFDLAVSLPWLAWQWVGYIAVAKRRSFDDLRGARILITGVHRGLGRDLTLRCLERGAEVIGVVRDAASRDALRADLPARARLTLVAADLSRPGMLAAALEENHIAPQSVTMVIVSAGTKHDGSSVLALTELRDTFEVNFFAPAELIGWLCGPDATVEHLSGDESVDSTRTLHRADAAGRAAADTAQMSVTTRVVLISSMGRWHGMPFSGGYNASKAALSIWGESLDLELRRRGKDRYTVTVVEPGIFASGMTRPTGLTRALFVSRAQVAERILNGALAGRATVRPPRWFALLTWAICLLGRDQRARLFARAKPRPDDR